MFFGKPSLQSSWSAICGSHCVLFFVCWKSKECSFGLKSCNWHDHLQMFCLEMCEGKSNIASWTRAQLLHISRTVIIYLHCDFFNGICLNVRAEYTVLYTISPLILINICIIFSMCQSLQFFGSVKNHIPSSINTREPVPLANHAQITTSSTMFDIMWYALNRRSPLSNFLGH